LRFLTEPVNLTDPDKHDVQKFTESVAAEQLVPALIVIDTLARNFGGGEENTSQDMSRFIDSGDKLRKDFSASVLVLHHPGKNTEKGARGHSALLAGVDMMMGLNADETQLKLT
jgi:RecA-family ATPase